MSELAELHILKKRVAELEETVEQIDRGQAKYELKLRDHLACAFAANGWRGADIWEKADEAMRLRSTEASLKEPSRG